jgi:hypothetical protein
MRQDPSKLHGRRNRPRTRHRQRNRAAVDQRRIARTDGSETDTNSRIGFGAIPDDAQNAAPNLPAIRMLLRQMPFAAKTSWRHGRIYSPNAHHRQFARHLPDMPHPDAQADQARRFGAYWEDFGGDIRASASTPKRVKHSLPKCSLVKGARTYAQASSQKRTDQASIFRLSGRDHSFLIDQCDRFVDISDDRTQLVYAGNGAREIHGDTDQKPEICCGKFGLSIPRRAKLM